MRKIIGLAVVAAAALTLVPAQAAPTNGTVLLPSAGTARAQRCDGVPNGTFGYVLDVTGGADFTLTADGGDDVNDFDIAFYKSITACTADADAVAAEGDHTPVAGDESGNVPPDAEVAIVTLYVGTPNSAFTYTEN